MNLFRAIQKNREMRRARYELESLSDHELADLGIFRADIPSVVSGKRRPN